MNKSAKKELLFLLSLGSFASYLLKRKKFSLGFSLGAAALALSTVSKPFSFKDKVVMITGGSRGLGLALAKRFAKEGAKVFLIARDRQELDRAHAILQEFARPNSILTCECDITNQEQLSTAFGRVLGRWGDIDVLVNNAGSILVGPFDSMTIEDFEAQMKLHLYANIYATQKILPLFRKKKDGRIINICSMGGKIAVPHMLPYDSSKFALAGFSQGIAAEFAKENIAVTTVYPTVMRTGSPIQAVFKGDSQREFAWFANADIFPGLSSDANEVAEKIVEASRERKSELIPFAPAKFRLFMGVLFPELALFGMGLINRLLPKGRSLMYRTGAQCLSDKTYLTPGLRRSAEKAEEDWNQKQKGDPEFNLGLH